MGDRLNVAGNIKHFRQSRFFVIFDEPFFVIHFFCFSESPSLPLLYRTLPKDKTLPKRVSYIRTLTAPE